MGEKTQKKEVKKPKSSEKKKDVEKLPPHLKQPKK